MSHTCPECNAELNQEDSYFRNFMREKLGDIYRCPNHQGFATEDEARAYAATADIKEDDWTEISCGSSVHHVSGSFHTDTSDTLYPGYPC